MRHRCSSQPHCCEKPDVRKARPSSTCHRFAFLIQMATSFAASRSPALQSASKIGLVTIVIFTAFRSQTKPLASSHVLLERLSLFLVAEELFACGCQLLISLTSAGQIVPAASPPYFVVIDRALRDDGTSYHYAAPDAFAEADPHIVAIAMRALNNAGLRAHVGLSWTTDAPFRETAAAVAAARAKGILAVEMEAAALYTFARKRNKAVLCLAHVTNTMGIADQDFEKGEADGTADALMILDAVAKVLRVEAPSE